MKISKEDTQKIARMEHHTNTTWQRLLLIYQYYNSKKGRLGVKELKDAIDLLESQNMLLAVATLAYVGMKLSSADFRDACETEVNLKQKG